MKLRWIALLTACLTAVGGIPAAAVAEPTVSLLDAASFRIYDENLVYIGADYLNPASVLFDD